jgi:hypothetical protein
LAADVPIDCDTGGSINAALGGLSPGDNNKITIEGTCEEIVWIIGFSNLTLEGGAGGATLREPSGLFTILFILRSNVTLRNLEFRGTSTADGATAMFISDATTTIEDCLIEHFMPGNVDGAIVVLEGGIVQVTRTIIQDNRVGISAFGGVVTVGLFEGDAGSPTIIRRNLWGILALGDVNLFGSTEIVENEVGVNVVHGGRVQLCCEAGQRKIADNQIGIVAQLNSQVSFIFSNLIEENSTVGLFLVGGSADIAGSTIIQQNGSFASSGLGGILATNNARVEMNGEVPFLSSDPEVSANRGTGIILTDGSSARLFSADINNNAGDGVRVLNLSVVRIEGSSIRGNGGFSLFCSKESFASGELSKADKAFCPKFKQLSEPALRIPII